MGFLSLVRTIYLVEDNGGGVMRRDGAALREFERAIMEEFKIEVDQMIRREKELLKIFEKIDTSSSPLPPDKRIRIPLLYEKEK